MKNERLSWRSIIGFIVSQEGVRQLLASDKFFLVIKIMYCHVWSYYFFFCHKVTRDYLIFQKFAWRFDFLNSVNKLEFEFFIIVNCCIICGKVNNYQVILNKIFDYFIVWFHSLILLVTSFTVYKFMKIVISRKIFCFHSKKCC